MLVVWCKFLIDLYVGVVVGGCLVVVNVGNVNVFIGSFGVDEVVVMVEVGVKVVNCLVN